MNTKLRTPIPQSFNHPIPRSWPTPGTPSDLLDALVRRAASGDKSAIAGLARVFRARLEREAARLVPVSEAGDLVQDLLLRLLEGSLAPPGEDQPAVPWLLGALAARVHETDR
jgi:hypothetical protein